MIKDGDKVLVGLSGGKDSLTLLHTLLDVQVADPPPPLLLFLSSLHSFPVSLFKEIEKNQF